MTDDEIPEFDPDDVGAYEAIAAMGKMGLTVFRSIIRDGGTWNEAFAVTGAFFAGSMKANMEDESD